MGAVADDVFEGQAVLKRRYCKLLADRIKRPVQVFKFAFCNGKQLSATGRGGHEIFSFCEHI
jgi:hypothetical protein